MKYIVCGTGRCGTTLGSKFLTSIGIPCSHEFIFTFNGLNEAIKRMASNDKFEADSSFMAVPFIDNSLFKDTKIIHFIRNPFNVIDSLMNKLRYFWDDDPNAMHQFRQYQMFMYKHFNLAEFKNPYTRAAAYYVRCNRRIECRKDVIVHHVESDIKSLLKKLDIDTSSYYYNKLENNWGPYKKSFSLSKIDNDQVREDLELMITQYGYNIKSFL